MSQNKLTKKPANKSLQGHLNFFLIGLLATATTFISLEKYKAATICVLVGGTCALMIASVGKIIDWLYISKSDKEKSNKIVSLEVILLESPVKNCCSIEYKNEYESNYCVNCGKKLAG